MRKDTRVSEAQIHEAIEFYTDFAITDDHSKYGMFETMVYEMAEDVILTERSFGQPEADLVCALQVIGSYFEYITNEGWEEDQE